MLVSIEDGNSGWDPVERAVVDGDLPVKLALRAFDRGDTDGCGGRSVLEGQHSDVVRFALSANDQRHAPAVAISLVKRARDDLTLALIQQLNLALLHLRPAERFDGFHVRAVDPGEAAIPPPQPDWHRQVIKQCAA